MVRLNITMPENLVKQLKSINNKSRFIAEALREKFDREKRRRLKKLMIEGYKKMADEDKKINAQWEPATLEDDWN